MTIEETIKICKQVRKYFKGGKLATDDTDAIYGALTEAIEALKKRKTGKWIYSYSDRSCSVCNALFDDEIVYMCKEGLLNYCPNCGARMVGEEE